MGLAKSVRGISRSFPCNENGPTRNAHAGTCREKTAAAAGSLVVISTIATVKQVQSSTETYTEGVAAAAEAAILQP
eukprot:7191302-Ditylum_brightwellii.AAC.1